MYISEQIKTVFELFLESFKELERDFRKKYNNQLEMNFASSFFLMIVPKDYTIIFIYRSKLSGQGNAFSNICKNNYWSFPISWVTFKAHN